MLSAPVPKNDEDRLTALRRYKVLDSDPERSFDDLTFLASFICQTPIALVSLVDKERQWFKSRIGFEAQETPRNMSFCGHAILKPKLLIVPDTFQDIRFVDNPLVIEPPHIRFYAGAPLYTEDGFALGTLCVMDRLPRNLSTGQEQALEALARQASAIIEFRRTLMELNDALGTIKLLGGILPICASCKRIRDEQDEWTVLEGYIQQHSEAKFSHSICPECAQRLYPDYYVKE